MIDSYQTTHHRPWAIILAGDDTAPLRPSNRLLTGEDRPRQFCKLIGGETPLEQTARRASCLATREEIIVVTTRGHMHSYGPDLRAAGGSVIAQPENRGVVPALLYGLLAVEEVEPEACVAVLPSDQHYENEEAFVRNVAHALSEVRESPERVLLLGSEDFSAVENQPVMVGTVQTLLGTIRTALPELWECFEDACEVIREVRSAAPMDSLYATLPAFDFLTQILRRRPELFTVWPMSDAGPVDIGQSARTAA